MSDCVLIFVAIICPPAAAAFVSGCGCDLIVNILLTLLGYIPGLIHALWLISQRDNNLRRYSIDNHGYTGAGTYASTIQPESNPDQSGNTRVVYASTTQPGYQQPNQDQSGNAPPLYKR